ncbi:DUF2793 domain-containing protein [Sphingomonas sp.]|uniref:DUF2793 domain-containing protein n=1 Tax=Sphingomonas sp. TaxID=28214 RepID=UPI0025E4D230|nr:DUF2793 domain-containing protein [Sphingomonas sp.]
MTTTSDRLNLPFLALAQSQKETTHNEALALLDMAVQPVVQAIAPATIPAAPVAGQCWIVGAAPGGPWSGHADALAAWTSGGWRFLAPFDGMTVWSMADGVSARRVGSSWQVGQLTAVKLVIGGNQVVGNRRPAIALPTGGATNDVQARATIALVIDTLTNHGLIS